MQEINLNMAATLDYAFTLVWHIPRSLGTRKEYDRYLQFDATTFTTKVFANKKFATKQYSSALEGLHTLQR